MHYLFLFLVFPAFVLAQNPDIDRLGQELNSPQIGIRRQAVIALGRASYPQSVRLLQAALTTESSVSIRLEIVRGLRHIAFQRFPGLPQALQALGRATDDALEKDQLVRLRASEALWEAGTTAIINTKSGSSFITSSHPSEPWFDKYSDFREELQLVARDYAIIPEFRISEHIVDYVKGGTFNKSNFDTFEIPGTTISSSQQNFYKDYSNSDFLREFTSIKDKSGLNAKEVMLTCKAAVRFNPYKGFYPAQRSLDLVSQFSSSFSSSI